MSITVKEDSEYYVENVRPAPVLTTAVSPVQLRSESSSNKDKSHSDTTASSGGGGGGEEKPALLTPLATVKNERLPRHDDMPRQPAYEVAAPPTTTTATATAISKAQRSHDRPDIHDIKRTDAVKSVEETKLTKLQDLRETLMQKRNQAEINNTKITGHLQESQVMDQLLAALKSLGSIVALDEACMDYLAEMSVESMQMQFHIIYGLLVNLRMRQTEACAKANLHMNVQYQALNQLQEKHHHLKRELRQVGLLVENQQASQMVAAMLLELKTYHYQASHYTKLKNKEIKALVERRDQLKVELAYCRLNRPPHTAPPNAATLDARAMEDIVYGASASSNGTMVVEIADEDKEYLRMAREHDASAQASAAAAATAPSSMNKSVPPDTTLLSDVSSVSAWTDHSGKPCLFEDSASYEQDDILRLNDLTIQKSHMMLKRLLNPN